MEFISFERQKVRFKHFFHQKYMLIPAHRPEAYALTKKYARMETALLQTFVVHHIPSTFPMEQLHCRARLSHKYIHVTLSRLQIHLPDLPTHTIHAHAHISRMLRHNYIPEFGISDSRFSCYVGVPTDAYYIYHPNNMDSKNAEL